MAETAKKYDNNLVGGSAGHSSKLSLFCLRGESQVADSVQPWSSGYGGDSCFKGCGFEFQHHILDGHFFKLGNLLIKL